VAKKLIIAEKPSVAGDIARALGGFTAMVTTMKAMPTFFPRNRAFGRDSGARAVRGETRKWSLANLPVLPPHFDLKPIERTEDRLKLLTRLMKRKDVTGLINACDAGARAN